MIDAAPVQWFDEIDSTSEETKRRARSGDLSPVWIVARQQTSGRGRMGRTWQSPQGNLFVSVLFPEPGGIVQALRIPFAAALAISDVCAAIVPEAKIELKWPNDVRESGRKLCGILIESGQTNDQLWVSVGIGINVRHTPPVADQPATSLVELGAIPQLGPEHVLDDLRRAFAHRLEQARSDFDQTRSAWLLRAEGLGTLIEAGPEKQRQRGVFKGLGPAGELILTDAEGQDVAISAGDVQLVKEV